MNHKKILFTIFISGILLTGCNKSGDGSYAGAVAAVEKGDYDNALVLFDTAEKEGESLKKILRGEGLCYLSLGEYSKAEQYFEYALHQSNGLIEATDIDISYYMAVAQYKDGKSEEALATLDAVMAISPQSDVATYLSGKIKLSMGDKEAALSDYDKTIELAPGKYENYIRICEDLRDAGFKDEGNIYIEKAMSLGGKMTDAVKGQLEYYKGSYTDARNDLENARKSKDSETVCLYLGRTYEALGDVDYAMRIYEEALYTYPTSGKLYNQLALAQIGQKNYQAAIETIEKGLEDGNGDASQSLLYNKMVAYEYQYDFKGAKTAAEEYLEKYPEDEEAKREYLFLSSR